VTAGDAQESASQAETEIEFERLSFVLHRLRHADYDRKAEQLARLKQVTVTTRPAVRLKELCVEAYTAHEESVTRLRQLDGRGPSNLADEALRRELALVERAAARAGQLTEECARLEHARR